VYGVTGSGKTTLAKEIGEVLGVPWHSVDDEIGWLPGWVERPRDEQRELASRIALSEKWVLDTAYGHWRDVVVPRADVIVALDYPRLVSLVNRPGSDGGSGYWIPTTSWSSCWAA
jgi:adenylate kinase family enzyme